MGRWIRISSVTLSLMLIATACANAGRWFHFDISHPSRRPTCQPCQSAMGGCCDDYCSKPLPCISPNCRGCIDDYCGKPLPCISCTRPGCVDDYCPKPCPRFIRPLCLPWYQCGPGERCYGGHGIVPGCDANSLK